MMKLGQLRSILNNLAKAGLSEDTEVYLQSDPEGNSYYHLGGIDAAGVRDATEYNPDHIYRVQEIEEDYPDEEFTDVLVVYP